MAIKIGGTTVIDDSRNLVNTNALTTGNYSSYSLPLTGGTISGSLHVGYGGGDLHIRSTSGGDLGDLVWSDYAGTEKHRLWDGGSGLNYRNNAGTGYFLLHAGNYNSYAPTLTGTGASGTWGISITGNAATATSATSAGSASAVAWTGVTGKPTTLSGYGITDSEYKHVMGVPRNNLGDPTVREMALFDGQFNNKTEFHDISKVYIETSTDNVNWTTLSVSDTEKRKLVGGDDTSGVTIPYGTPYFRIRLRAINYVYLNALYSYWSSNGHSTKAQIFAKHDSAGSWTTIANSTADVASWPGHLYLPFSTIPWMIGGTLGSHYDEVYVLFIPNWNATYSAYGISLYRMQWWGGYPAGKRNLYATDSLANATFPAGLSSVGALTQNGNQVLHAGNYNSYSPSLTGSGASGTWGINVTGNAATATTASSLSGFTNSSSANPVSGADSLTQNGHAYVTGMSLLGQTDGALYAQAYSSSWVHQIFGDYRTGQIAVRGKNSGTWQSWRTVLDSSNFTSYSPTLTGSGASGTWSINITGTASNVTGTVAIANGGTGQTTKTEAFDALAPTTTKGDLIVSNGSDNVRLPVGANNQVLTADSAQASGVKWATMSSMVYPASGIAVSTGSAWGTSLTAPAGAIVGTTDTQTLTNKTLSGPVIAAAGSPNTSGVLSYNGYVLSVGNGSQASEVAMTTVAQTLFSKTISAGIFSAGYTEAVATANTGTAYTINLASGSVQILTLTGNCTFTFPTATAGKSFMLLLKQDATGSRTVTWPSAVKWPGGTAPTITATASKMDKYIFTSDGTNWYGSDAGKNYTV